MAEEETTPPTTVMRRGPRIKGSLVLIIEDFGVEMENCDIGEEIQSDKFYVKDAKLAITVYPNGESEEEKGNVSVFLSNEGKNKAMVKKMKFNVCGEILQDGDIQLGRGQERGFWVFSHEDCRAKLIDGTLKVKVEVEMLSDRRVVKRSTEIPKSSNHWLLEEMYSNNMKDSDFTLVCEDQKIPCHKLVLSSASAYFKGMMNPTAEQFKEYKEGSVAVQCSEQVGHGFVKFLYTAEIQKTVLEDNYEIFLRLADYYHVDRLKQYVEQRMIQDLERTNMVVFYIAGDVYNAGEIREASKQYIRDNLDWLKGREDWRGAFGNKKDLIIEILL